LEKIAGYMLSKNLNFRQSVLEELTKVTIVCVDTPFLSYFILIYHHADAVLARQPMSQQRADAVGTDVMLCARPEFIEEPQQKGFH